MKKVLKITGITFLVLLALLTALPFAFQSQIKDMVKRFINQNLNAQVEFSDVSLSFLRSFPQAHVSVSDLVITNFEPFKDETLLSAKNIAFTVSVKELLKKADDGPVVVNTIDVDEALLTLKIDKFGNTNYDIIKEKEFAETNPDSHSFSFDIEKYGINNSAVTYMDDDSNIIIHITELNHAGKGKFSADTSELDTKSEANVSFSFDSINYLNNNHVKLDALIGLDLTNYVYTFKENTGLINQLPIEFKGFVKAFEDSQEVDISFENPESSFKNFLAVIPEVYSKNIENVETTGDFKVKGNIKGLISDETIPTLDINIISNNASFKYPDLPKRIENITINTTIKNETGNSDDTFIDIKTLNFKIDNDIFKSSMTLKNITKNMLVNANINGVLNLANITKAYPITLDRELSGILKAKLSTAFDMNALETNAYARIKNSGTASITDFIFSSEDMDNPIHVTSADMTFNPSTIILSNFKAKIGESDIDATGTIQNLLGFLLSKNDLQGNFNLNSNIFKVSDFLTKSQVNPSKNNTASSSKYFKIPAFLDCTINANANTVVYDNLNLKDVKGTLFIKDQRATLQNMMSSIFDGALSASGNVSTKNETPTFNFNLGANGFDISQSFKGLELLQNLAPIAKLLQGKLNTSINISGDLDKEFSPNLSTVSGNALAELLTNSFNANQGELFNKLEGALSFIDFDKLNLKDLKTKLEFSNGKVSVKPFDLKYEDIAITVSGSHGFDKTLEYSAIFNVPAKYLGSEVNRLIGKINDDQVNQISIPITASIGGTYTNPSVKTDLTSGVSNLTKQLIDIEKQKLLNQGKDKLNSLIGDVIGGNKSKTDSLKTQQNNTVKDVLGDIVGSNKTKTDSTTMTPKTTDAVKNALEGLLNKKKKAQDTISK